LEGAGQEERHLRSPGLPNVLDQASAGQGSLLGTRQRVGGVEKDKVADEMTAPAPIEVEILTSSAHAVRVTDAYGTQAWLPKRVITLKAVPSADGKRYGRVTMPDWLLKKTGLR
jgi:hypothetical protein